MSNSSPSFEDAPFEGLSDELFEQLPNDSSIWQNLKQAISASSGFQRWKLERTPDLWGSMNQDALVRLYLRETLETLAY